MLIERSEDGAKSEMIVVEEEEDDLEMRRIIASTRREHLKTASAALTEVGPEIEDKFIGGKSFDALMMAESIFREEKTKFEIADEKFDELTVTTEEGPLIESAQEAEESFSSEPLVRNGVAATLALLNMRGINLKPRSQSEAKNSSDIKLEYFDQFGNKLSSKEAYKELSRKFHGKGPGKGKLEKMKRRREETLKLESVSASTAAQSAIVTNLRRQQEETGESYMVLSNTRQTETKLSSTQESEVKRPKIFGLQLKK